MEVPKESYEALAREIGSEESPVGIDAKKTHIMILHQLAVIQQRLDWITARLEGETTR